VLADSDHVHVLLDKVTEEIVAGLYGQAFGAQVAREDLAKIAKAKKVEMRFIKLNLP